MSENMATDKQGRLTFDPSTVAKRQKGNRGGPPNRMNDLVYRDWMKFQKSFFRFASDQALIEECVVLLHEGGLGRRGRIAGP